MQLQLAEQIETILARHLDVQQKHVREWMLVAVRKRGLAAQIVQGHLSIPGTLEFYREPRLLKTAAKHKKIVLVILSDQNALLADHTHLVYKTCYELCFLVFSTTNSLNARLRRHLFSGDRKQLDL